MKASLSHLASPVHVFALPWTQYLEFATMQYALVLALLFPAVVFAARPRQIVRVDADNNGIATQVLTYRDGTNHVGAVQAQVTLNCRAGEHRNMYEVTVNAVDSLPRSEQSRLDIKNAQEYPMASTVGRAC